MPANLISTLGDSLHIFATNPANWLDVLIIASLAYIILRLLLEARSLSVAIGILILSVLYWISFLFNLPLTNLFLKTFFGFFIIFIAIIFQRELRRLFSFVGFFRFQRVLPPAQATMDTLAHAVATLSSGRVGALIVCPGRESISRHFEKGIPLNGELSQELLLSIFSEETPGHDGAAIVENNRLRQFGVHLPLTETTDGLGKFGGLRHRAALGLSERSDAFVIVVSGETGSIDVALRGAWEHCADATELRKKLVAFSRALPQKHAPFLSNWLKKDVLLFLASFVLAGMAWGVYSPDFAQTQKNFTVSLEFRNVPPGYVVRDVVPRQVVLSLKGKTSDFDVLSPQSLNVSVDLSSVQRAGWKTIPLATADAEVPLNFSAVQLSPKNVQVDIANQ